MGEYDPQAIVDSYTERDKLSRVDRSSDAALMFQTGGGLDVLEIAGTPVIAACLGPEMDKALQDPDAWAYVIETEKKACTVPGLVGGTAHHPCGSQRSMNVQEP